MRQPGLMRRCFALLCIVIALGAHGTVNATGGGAPPVRLGLAADASQPHAAGYVLVKASGGARALAGRGRRVEHLFGDWYKIAVRSNETAEQMMMRLAVDPAIDWVELDYIVQAEPMDATAPVADARPTLPLSAQVFTPDDPLYPQQWHFPIIQAPEAWERSTGSGVVVAVIDSGVTRGSDLQCRNFVDEYNALTNQSGPGVAHDGYYHGTHVAGTVAQCTNNALGVAGVAFNADLMPIKVLDDAGGGRFSDVASGIYWATEHGADVINLSLGGSSSSSVLADALDQALAADIFIVAAAGNTNSAVFFPARHPGVTAVGAITKNWQRASYSNKGEALDLVAPGGDKVVESNGILQHTIKNGEWSYLWEAGTSMAAPHVAGAAALLRSAYPDATRAEIEQALIQSALDLGAPGKDIDYGYGLIQIDAALRQLGGQAVTPTPTPTPTVTTTPHLIWAPMVMSK